MASYFQKKVAVSSTLKKEISRRGGLEQEARSFLWAPQSEQTQPVGASWHAARSGTVLVFSDDILVYSKILEDHVVHLKKVLQVVEQDKWQVKVSKCSFAQRKIDYLVHVILEAGVEAEDCCH
jgi:hypothetical protein